MAEVFRAKTREWAPVPTNQIRLRHLRQICVRRLTLNPPPVTNDLFVYYTLHVTTMSSPFYTSECLSSENIDWGDIDTRKFPDDIVSSCPGVVVRIWVKEGNEEATPRLVSAWGVYFTGLDYVGAQLPKEITVFRENTVVFVMPWGYFTAESCLNVKPAQAELVSQCGKSYSLSSMCRIHRLQRAIYKEKTESERLRQEIQAVQLNPYRYLKKSRTLGYNNAPFDYAAVAELQIKRQEILYTVNMLQYERNRQVKQVDRLKEHLKTLKSGNQAKSQQLKENYFEMQVDKDKLSDSIKDVAVLEDQVWDVNQQLIERRRQLFQELAFIFPITQVKDKVWTISNVALPDSDCLNGCDDVQLGVGLGYVAHLVHMISVLVQVPNRYPIAVHSSTSRITDLVTKRETDAPKEFPLYAKGKDRLHFEYGVYLLNKNIAQLRWLFGMATTNLAATLSNLASLMLHLTAPPPSDDKRQTTRETGAPRTTYRYKSSKLQPQRVSSLAGSQASLTGSASSMSLDRVAESPVQNDYFKRAPDNWKATSTTLSLDLAVDRPFVRSRIECLDDKSALHGSAPDLTSPDKPIVEHCRQVEELKEDDSKVEQPASQSAGSCHQVDEKQSEFESLFNDAEISSVSARTEALAISSGTFKMNRRGQST